ncbi:unnamed protein product [Rotaria magnacalcarata]|uniref:Uncharacterized protein n=1 Tax=Rotaria magnacalcarata TaxID=392030 RepID=A0A8S3AGI5_9BILA|nr:unnamed protein product [Rotaria magnacalcarata]
MGADSSKQYLSKHLLQWYNMCMQHTDDNSNQLFYSSNLTPLQLLSIFEAVAAYATGTLMPLIVKRFHDAIGEVNSRDHQITEEALIDLETALLTIPVESWSTDE